MLEAHGYEAVPERMCGPRSVAEPVGGTVACYRRSRTA
jgi:hypothetical protein